MANVDPFFSSLERFEIPSLGEFPYLFVSPEMGINHVILLPSRLTEHSLRWIADQQSRANRLPVTLVLSEMKSVYYCGNLVPLESARSSFTGFPIAGAIEACVRFRPTKDLRRRTANLEEIVARHPMKGFQFGDPWKGGLPATEHEAQWLFGRNAEGVPAGLTRCAECGDWKGECLDRGLWDSYQEDVLVPVSCRCENWNRCARCHRSFDAHRLASNYFDPADGSIRYVPGIRALEHRC